MKGAPARLTFLMAALFFLCVTGNIGAIAGPTDAELLSTLRSGNAREEQEAMQILAQRVHNFPAVTCYSPRVDIWPISRELGLEILKVGEKRAELSGNFFRPAAAAMRETPELFGFVHQRFKEYLAAKGGPTKFDYLSGTIALAASPRVGEALPELFQLLDTRASIYTALPVAAAGESAREGLQRRVRADGFTRNAPGYWKAVLSALAGIIPDPSTSQFLWDKRSTTEWAPLRSCVDVALARAKWQPLFVDIVEQLKAGGVGEPSVDTLNAPLSKHILSQLSEEKPGPMNSVSRTALLGPNSISLLQYYDRTGWNALVSLLSSPDAAVVKAAAVELSNIGPAARGVSEDALRKICDSRVEIGCFALRRIRGEETENPTPFPWNAQHRVVVYRQ